MSYQSQDSQIQGRQLAAQRVVVQCNLVAGTSDLPSNVAIDNSTIATTSITLDVNQSVAKAFAVRAHNRTTGAVLPLLAVPSVSGETVAISVNGTGISDAVIEFIYEIA